MNRNSGTFPNANDETQDLTRKIAVMKKAILKEREEKSKETEEIENLKKKVSVLEINLSEKDLQAQTIIAEKEAAEKELAKLKDSIRNSNSGPQGTKKNVASLEQQNKKLLDEYYFLKQQNADLKNMISALTQEHSQIQKELVQKDVSLAKVKHESQKILEQDLAQQRTLEAELKDSQTLTGVLLEAQNKLSADLAEAYANQRVIEEESNVLGQELLMIQGRIASLQEKLLTQSKNEATLSSKLMDYKDELDEAEGYYQKHELIKITSSGNVPATIIFKLDHNGDFCMQIEENKNKSNWEMQNVNEISGKDENPKRIYIKFIDAQELEFETNNADMVVVKMNKFLTNARNHRPNT